MARETTEFNSTNLANGSFDPDTGDMTLTFKSGRSYNYGRVPAEKWEGLKNAASAGRYFNDEIKGQHEA